jgi:Family of unknown function (DUF6076)
MGYASVKWEKFPRFVQYANERERLYATPDPAALAWARQFVGLIHKGAGGATWTQEEAWEQLRAHQREFRRLLEALIAGPPTHEQMQVMTEHLRHMQPQRSWDGSPDKVREQAAQRYAEPDRWERLREALLAQGLGDPGSTPPQRGPLSRYVQSLNAQDPLDALYVELDQFLAKEGQSRLRQCPQCGQYFVQATARPQAYCTTPCQQKANPTKAQKNAEYQRKYRATQRKKQIKKDLERVSEFRQEFITARGVSPMVEDVLARLHIGRRRWNTLVNWEIDQYGSQRATDLIT